MTITCKAAVLREVGLPAPYADSRPLAIEEITLDPPEPTDLVVRITGGGLCHSDLSIIAGVLGRGVPVVLGHEGAGEVVEVGSAVRDVAVGDSVVFQFSAACGRCAACLSGRPQICAPNAEARAKGELLSGGSRIRDAEGRPLRHHSGVSCFAEYAVVNRGSVVVVDRDTPQRTAALFGCAVMTGVGAVVNTAGVRPGETVAIFGLGGVGQCGIMGAKLSGAGIIIGVDPEPAKREKAKALGATHVFDSGDNDLAEKIRDLTRGGVDYAVDLAGAVPALEAAYAATARGGKVITAGIAPAGSTFAFSQPDLVLEEKSILGSFMGSCVPVRDIPRFLEMHAAGLLPVDALVDRVIGFDEINEGFDLLASGQAMRQILAPHG
ncbi:zinc-binding dehydrogenase [Albimonas sp. CAU 1670]|uniref:zinc-binding dehydrogenase n=1 Tax=Albimonas sp. CAU 1670 TaxID=3032599 RepID=UPI0023DC1888|nr:zinc-binding dehydrogenase [Albimonas sp. CAU 1670]MDF2234830.1 zinc-binding dehydrogenase [Albimonas sp. CAU 1670]